MKRHKSPSRTVQVRRFSANEPSLRVRLTRALRTLPIGVPLCAGMLVAGVVHALLPSTSAALSPPPLLTPASASAATSAPSAMTAGPASSAASAGTSLAPSPLSSSSSLAPTATTMPAETRMAARTTRDLELEARIDKLLVDGKTPWGAVVVMDAHSGRVLAMAEHATNGPSDGIALRPIAPAASVFKIVTTDALLAAGVAPGDDVCFHGGKTRMSARLLKDDPRRDRCIPFGDVLPKSANVAVAKLASRKLAPATLRAEAARWGFGTRFANIAGLEPSTAVIPDDPFGFAEAAAGFGDVKISALHGAVIASIVANDGVFVKPRIDADAEPGAPTRVLTSANARALRRMMADTVTDGTARRAFQARPRLPVSAGGKTGSLTDYDTGLDTSWFVGFAPAEAPELVVAALVVNTAKWHIKAPWLAKESLRLALDKHGPARAGARVASR